MPRPIYLDHHATTPLDPRVFEAMRPYFLEAFGNPHSADHAYGWEAEAGVEAARRAIARLIGAAAGEIVFTSGATEANNLALRGAAARLPEGRRHLVASTIEHPCVAAVIDRLEADGFPVTRVGPGADGIVPAEAIAAALRPETGLVTVMAANHEIGTLQPIGAIGALTRARGILFHSDAAQAAGKVPFDVVAAKVDLMSLSAHKMYGPKGIGALHVRRGVALEPLILGGGQERGLRSGTVPAPLAVGFGAAAAIARDEMAGEASRLKALRERLRAGLSARIAGLRVNGDLERRLPGNLDLALPGIAAIDLIHLMKGRVAVSAGSACASASLEPSPVLGAIGLDDAAALGSIRIGLGRGTTEAEIDAAIAAVAEAWSALTGLACAMA
ncbi:IscS subfamily cysteine desulfurase [Prosthecomicrobium hirschii]|uniref:cysteine desulfurase family protein n=1 Tax=Prosthecodimorpha hirschii TaxID=665126 RepID=UPI0011297810|nr:cysteine desulfurase family protein [Prosthecomicrobium hirschii]TPQ52144.1 IscS subfamily cysteine desulfurase [Prosthecomicrobium hirschii]